MQPQQQPETRPGSGGSALSGLLTIFYSPADTFVPRRRGWLVPLVAACLAITLTNFVAINRVGMGTIVRNQLEANPAMAERLGPEGIRQAVERAESGSLQKTMAYVGGPVAIVAMIALMSGLALGGLLIMGASTTYSAVFTAVAWATYAALAVACAGTTAVLYSMSDFSGVDVSRAFQLNAGMFAADASPVTRALLSGIDLIAAWVIFLETVGVTKLSARVTAMQAAIIFISLHVVVTLLRVGWAAMFG